MNIYKLQIEALHLHEKLYENWKSKILRSGEQYKAMKTLIRSRKRGERRDQIARREYLNEIWKEDIETAERNW